MAADPLTPLPAPTASANDKQEIPSSVRYDVLCTTHPTYDRKLIVELNDLYKGGYTMMRKADDYLVRLCGETDERFEERKQLATYQNHFGQIVDQFASDVFAKSLMVTPASDAANPATPGTDTKDEFYTNFAKNADGKGTTFDCVMKDALTTALKHKRAAIMVDAPRSDVVPINRAEEEKQGLGLLYIYELDLLTLIDWEVGDDDDTLLWIMIRKAESKRINPLRGRDTINESFTLWGMNEGVAEWVRYAVTYEKAKPPKPDDLVPAVDRGSTKFDRIPLFCMELPDGLWVGNKIGPNALEYFRRRSSLVGSENRNLVAIPFFSMGPEVGAPGGEMPSEVQQKSSRSRGMYDKLHQMGYIPIGSGDEIGFAEPSGACHAQVATELKEVRDEMFAVNHQMAASVRPTTTALGRSGLSKQKDQEATEKVLASLGTTVRETSVELFDFIAKTRGDNVKWTPHGLDNYETVDRESLLEEAVSMDQVAIPSKTFHILQKTDVANKLTPQATPQERDVMRKEIVEGVGAEHEIGQLQKEAEKDAILNPPEPTPPKPGAKAPGATPPKAPAAPTPGAKPKAA